MPSIPLSQTFPGDHSRELPPSSEAQQPRFIQKPAPVSIAESDNTDVIALRAALSVLQVQKQKAQKDIMTLQKLKEAAIKDPSRFASELAAGNLTHEALPANPLHATFEDDESQKDSDDADVDSSTEQETAIPKIPNPQNVFRCPAINWDKYHVIGESLDRMHEHQRSRPGPYGSTAESPRDHVIFAPYNPFKDKLPATQK